MNISNADRKQILETLISTIADVSDAEYQKRVWIEGQGPECDDFDEFVSYFFDETEAVLNDYQKFGITDVQYQLLKSFQDELKNFCNKNYYPKEFISSSEWKKIMLMAKEILKAFNF